MASLRTDPTVKYVVSYLALYAATLALLVRFEHFGIVEPLLVLAAVGGGFTLIAWLLTRHLEPLPAANPRGGVPWYLFVVVAFATWGLGAVTTSQPLHDIVVLLAKIAVFVAIPWLIFDRASLPLRFKRRDLFIALGMAAVLLAFQFFFGRGAHEIANAQLSAARLTSAFVFGFVWLCLEAGLVEEYFFRRLLQTGLEQLTRSSVSGIVLASLLFGLVHAPGLYLRTANTGEALGSSPSLLLAFGYAIVIVSPTGFFLGTLWSRTRNLAIVVVVHGVGDLLPNVVDLAHHLS
jgi:membrane protease YdiL (CAAX protease family)